MQKLNKYEVNNLYKFNPDLEDPYFEGKKHLYTVRETAYFTIDVDGDVYVVKSNPSQDDEWYLLTVLQLVN